MIFILSGKVYQLNDLETNLDNHFPLLHAAYLGNIPFSWGPFHVEAVKFLIQTPERSRLHNAYFNNFTHIWRHLLAFDKFEEANQLWELALQPALIVDQNLHNQHIHKGTAFYYWGITALLKGDIDKGYSLMHQAVEEDIITEQKPYPDTPAYALATLNWAKQDQGFRQWVIKQAEFLGKILDNYSGNYSRQFKSEDLRQKFLVSPPSGENVFLFVYTLARLIQLGNAPAYTVQSRFAAQLFINILFDISLTIEEAVKVKNPSGRSFIYHAEYLANVVGCPLSIAKLGEVNGAFNQDFDNSIRSLLDGKFTFADQSCPSGMQVDIVIAYGVRNRAAHNTSPALIVSERFNDIAQALFNVLFMTIDFAY